MEIRDVWLVYISVLGFRLADVIQWVTMSYSLSFGEDAIIFERR